MSAFCATCPTGSATRFVTVKSGSTAKATGGSAISLKNQFCHGASATFLAGRQLVLTQPQRPIAANSSRLRIEAKGRKNPIPGRTPPGSQMAMSVPKVEMEEGTVYYILFVKNKKLGGTWYPLTVLTGGNQADALQKIMASPFGKKLFSGVLTRTLSTAVYRDEAKLKDQVVRGYGGQGMFTANSSVQWGYKVMIPADGTMKDVRQRLADIGGDLLDGVRGKVSKILPKTIPADEESK